MSKTFQTIIQKVSFQGESLAAFFSNLTGVKFLNASGSLNLIEDLNSTLLQNFTKLELLDLGNLELLESTSGHGSHIFKTLQSLQNLLMKNVTIRGLSKKTQNGTQPASKMQNLTFLSLGESVCKNCSFWSLLGECANLSTIDLSFSEGFDINSTFTKANFPNLQALNLSRGAFSSVGLFELPELKVLDVSAIGTSRIELSGLPNLEFLNFSTEGISMNISSEDFSGTKIETLVLSELPHLQWIDFSHSKIDTVSLRNLPKLQTIYFKDFSIGAMSLENLTSLEALNLSNSNAMDMTLDNLPNLEVLDLSNSQSDINNVVVQKLPQLEKVSLFNSTVKFTSFDDLSSLKLVNFSNTDGLKLVLRNIPNLDVLDLSNSTLRKIKIANASNLTSLDLSFITNRELIAQVNISQFLRLANVNLSFCELLEVPQLFTGLEFLRSLDLSHNFLDQLPDKLLPPAGKCKLVNLDLSHNYFEVIPSEVIKPMVDPYTCWTIDLEDNPLNCSDCNNSWLTLESFSGNIENALCQLPFEKLHKKVQDVEICGADEND